MNDLERWLEQNQGSAVGASAGGLAGLLDGATNMPQPEEMKLKDYLRAQANNVSTPGALSPKAIPKEELAKFLMKKGVKGALIGGLLGFGADQMMGEEDG